jgi:hypothetical protein
MARPKKKAADLVASGARRGRINARISEEEAAKKPKATAPAEPGISPDALAAFLAAIAKERSTFSERVMPGQTGKTPIRSSTCNRYSSATVYR